MTKTKRVKTTDGGAGGYLVGDKHSDPSGGIKVENKSTGEKILVEGGEAVITAPALDDPTLHEWEGKQMTKREILSDINVKAGGRSFGKGGRTPRKIRCTGKMYKFGGETMTDHDIVSSCGCKHAMEKGGEIENIPLALRQIIEDDNIQIVSAEKIKDADDEGDGEQWEVKQRKYVYEVRQDYDGNQGDPIITEEFDTLQEAEENLDSLEAPESWETATTDHYAFIQKVTQKRTAKYELNGSWDNLGNEKWDYEDSEDLGKVKSFGTREGDTSDLRHQCHFHLSQDVSGEYKIGDNSVRVKGRPSDNGYTAKYSNLFIYDKQENEIGYIELRMSDHSYNPSNNAGKSSDGFISVVIANKDQTKQRFSGSHNLYFDGGNSYEDIVEAVTERIQEIVDGLDIDTSYEMEKGGELRSTLLTDISKIELPAGYKMYEGHPDQLLNYIQEQSTGMMSDRKSVNTLFAGYDQMGNIFGKDITIRSVEKIPDAEKQMILKAWKGKALNPELRKALRTKTMELRGSMSQGGSMEKSEKSDNFTSKGISHEVQHILSAQGQNSDEALIYTVADYLRASKRASQQGQNKNLWKQQERKILLKYIDDNSIWIDNVWQDKYISEGAEQKVYLFDSEYVVKFNDGIFYSSWLDYFNSILIHNHYFPDTHYQLIGFFKKDEILFSVLKQPFIQETSLTNPLHIKQFLTANGFINKKENNYYNPDIGLILEDLHQGNVLTKKGVPYFIDTVFYITDENGDITTYEKGGQIENQAIISKFQTDMENIDQQIREQNKRMEETVLFALMGARNTISTYEQKKISIKRLLIMLVGYEKDIKDYHAELTGIATQHSDNAEKLSAEINRHKHAFFSRNYSYSPAEYEIADDQKLCVDAKKYSDIVKTIVGNEAELWSSVGELRFFVINELEEFVRVCEELKMVQENILSKLGLTIQDIDITGKSYDNVTQTIKDKIISLEQQKNRLIHQEEVLTDTGIELRSSVPEGTEERLMATN